MNTPTIVNNQTEIIGRAIDHRSAEMSPEVASFILSLELADEDRLRMDELAAKARAGSLSEMEDCEIEEYRRSGRLMEMLKLKARLILGRA